MEAKSGSSSSHSARAHICAAPATAHSDSGVVVHLDADCFFVQVEICRRGLDPLLPVCVDQHHDIISMNQAAKDAGVHKHMLPEAAQRTMGAGGTVVPVAVAGRSGRVSYRVYQAVSRLLVGTIRACAAATVATAPCEVEVASIDEAYVAVPGSGDEVWVRAIDLAARVREVCRGEHGYILSAGVAPNRLLAKMASAQSKPDGLHVARTDEDVERLLQATSAHRLPGLGSQRRVLAAAGVGSVADIQQHSAAELAALLKVERGRALEVYQMCRGNDNSVVKDKGPANVLSAQTSLRPFMHPIIIDGKHTGHFRRPIRLRDLHGRLAIFVHDMAVELLQRLLEHAGAAEGPARVPHTLAVALRRTGVPGDAGCSQPCPPLPVRQVDGPHWGPCVEQLTAACLRMVQRLLAGTPDAVVTRLSITLGSLRPRRESCVSDIARFLQPRQSVQAGGPGSDTITAGTEEEDMVRVTLEGKVLPPWAPPNALSVAGSDTGTDTGTDATARGDAATVGVPSEEVPIDQDAFSDAGDLADGGWDQLLANPFRHLFSHENNLSGSAMGKAWADYSRGCISNSVIGEDQKDDSRALATSPC